MIFYFSGTGNSRWIAQKIAEKTGDTAVDIISLTEKPDISKEKQVGFVYPVYAWGTPKPVTEFAKALNKSSGFAFAVSSCGKDTGNAMEYLDKIYPLNSFYSIEMPSNYIMGFDVEDKKTIERKIAQAKKYIEKISQNILEQKNIKTAAHGHLPAIKTALVFPLFCKHAVETKPFYAKENCNGCSVCAKICPAKAIEMQNGKPQWTKKQCHQCTGCINRCPQKAIEYGKATAKRGRYYIEEYL